MTYHISNKYSFLYKGKALRDDELEQIESWEEDDGVLLEQFVIKGLENSPIYKEPRIKSANNNIWTTGTMASTVYTVYPTFANIWTHGAT